MTGQPQQESARAALARKFEDHPLLRQPADRRLSDTRGWQELYLLVMGRESNGFTILELGYSLGLAIGILVFFNHFAALKLNTDPTPLEVEMRLYEDNIAKTLIAQQEEQEQKGTP